MITSFYDYQVNLLPLGCLLHNKAFKFHESLLELIHNYLEKNKTPPIILFSATSYDQIKDCIGNLSPYDNIPTLIGYYSGHQALINQTFLDYVGLKVQTDYQELTPGWLQIQFTKSNLPIVKKAWSLQTLEQRTIFAHTACDYYLSLGCKGFDTFDGWGDDPEIDWEVIYHCSQKYPLRIRLLMQGLNESNCSLIQKYKNIAYGTGEYWVDGSIGAETAAISLPYNSGNLAKPYLKKQDIQKAIEFAFSNDLVPCLHTIGDLALDNILECLESLNEKERIVRLIHLCIVREDQLKSLEKFKNNIELVINPGFYNFIEIYKTKVHPDLHRYLLPYNRLLQAGFNVRYGSDAPVTLPNPVNDIQLLRQYRPFEGLCNDIDYTQIFF